MHSSKHDRPPIGTARATLQTAVGATAARHPLLVDGQGPLEGDAVVAAEVLRLEKIVKYAPHDLHLNRVC